MIFARQEAPDPARSALRSLRPSLNTPVVVVEDLPAGPASAAIACLGEPAGPRVVLAIRSERSGQAIFFGPDDELRDWQAPDGAIDAALEFAESMGFLFEEDRLPLAPAETQRLWGDLLDACTRRRLSALATPAAVPGTLPWPTSAEHAVDELWLEEIEPAQRAVGPSLCLTKFRREPAPAPRRSATPERPAAARPLARFQVGLQRRST